MKSKETPKDFDINKKINQTEITYTNLKEIVQGGPEIGTISINGISLKGDFGGPCIYANGNLYAPNYVRKFFGRGFRLAKINIQTLKIEYLTKIKSLIYLQKIERGEIYFFEDLNERYLRRINIESK